MFRAEFGGLRENVWSRNGVIFATREDAESYAVGLLHRWTGADIARVVPIDTPDHQPLDLDDPQIVANYRSA